MNKFNYADYQHKIPDVLNTFLIIGAMDGIKHDTFYSKILTKKNKKIIFVEPVLYYFNILKENVKKIVDSEVTCLNFAVSNIEETVKFNYVNPPSIKKYKGFVDGCSCVVENGTPLNRFIREIDPSDLIEIEIKCSTVESILNSQGWSSVDYVQIDTEGYDQRIVNALNVQKFDIKFLQFERSYADPIFVKKYTEEMSQKGFYFDVNGDAKIIRSDILEKISK